MTTIFEKIIQGEIPSEKVYEDEDIYAFRDINPQAPVHILIIPRKPIPGISGLKEEDSALMGKLLYAAKKVAEHEGLADYRLVINNGARAGQTVFHLHLHLLGGRLLTWPPG